MLKKKYDVILHSRMLKDKGIYEYIESIKIIIKKKKKILRHYCLVVLTIKIMPLLVR